MSRCRHCRTRPVWRYHNNDIAACKRCYHEVWGQTRRRIRELHTAIGSLERGKIPEPLKTYGKMAVGIAKVLLKELEPEAWRSGAKHKVPVLPQRCQCLIGQGGREGV
jgi:hypothetical protein